MKILLLSHEMTYTGAPNSLLNVARVLRGHRHSVDIYTLRDGDFSDCFRRYGFSVKPLCEETLNSDRCRYFAANFDIALCNTVFCGKAALKLQKYMPVILYIREAQNLPEIMKNNGIPEDCICFSDNVICVSDYARSFIEKTYAPKNITTLHNFLIKPSRKTATPNRVYGKVRFMIAATIEPRKGISVAVEAFEMLPPELREKAVLDIYGRAPEWAADYHGSLFSQKHEGVTYHGELTHGKSQMYKTANVVLVPSFDESCSLTALEGAMYARALIVTENVGAKYLIDANGFVVKTGSAESLSRAMRFFIEHSSELEAAGYNSYKSFKKFSDKNAYYKSLKKIIREVLCRKNTQQFQS